MPSLRKTLRRFPTELDQLVRPEPELDVVLRWFPESGSPDDDSSRRSSLLQ